MDLPQTLHRDLSREYENWEKLATELLRMTSEEFFSLCCKTLQVSFSEEDINVRDSTCPSPSTNNLYGDSDQKANLNDVSEIKTPQELIKEHTKIVSTAKPVDKGKKRRIKTTLVCSYGLVNPFNGGAQNKLTLENLTNTQQLNSSEIKKKSILVVNGRAKFSGFLVDFKQSLLSKINLLLGCFFHIQHICDAKIFKKTIIIERWLSDGIGRIYSTLEDILIDIGANTCLNSLDEFLSNVRQTCLISNNSVNYGDHRKISNKHDLPIAASGFTDSNPRGSCTEKNINPRESLSGFSITTSDINLDNLLDGMPTAYNDRRDSRNGSRSSIDNFLYSNRQKVRDAFHDWVRKVPVGTDYKVSRHQGLHSHSSSAAAIVASVVDENIKWFVSFIVDEYIRAESASLMRHRGEKNRIQLLEERLIKRDEALSTGRINFRFNVFFQFVLLADSNRIYNSIKRTCIDRLGFFEQDGLNSRYSSETSESIFESVCLSKLFAIVTKDSLSTFDDPIIVNIVSKLDEITQSGRLLIHLPWVVSFLSVIEEYSKANSKFLNAVYVKLLLIRRAISHVLNPTTHDYVVLIMLDNLSNALTCASLDIETPRLSKKDLVTTDFNMNISSRIRFGIILQSMSINEFDSFVIQVSLMKCPCLEEHQSKHDGKENSESTGTPAHRKVRPTIFDDSAAIQKRLRQWFWWQYPGFKQLCDSMMRYLKEEGIISLKDLNSSSASPVSYSPTTKNDTIITQDDESKSNNFLTNPDLEFNLVSTEIKEESQVEGNINIPKFPISSNANCLEDAASILIDGLFPLLLPPTLALDDRAQILAASLLLEENFS